LDCIYFVNSGSEANDLACLIARNYNNNHTIYSLRNGYHGGVGTAYHLTSLATWKTNVIPLAGHEKVASPNFYRGPFYSTKEYIDDLKDSLETNSSGKIAGFIAEPI